MSQHVAFYHPEGHEQTSQHCNNQSGKTLTD